MLATGLAVVGTTSNPEPHSNHDPDLNTNPNSKLKLEISMVPYLHNERTHAERAAETVIVQVAGNEGTTSKPIEAPE